MTKFPLNSFNCANWCRDKCSQGGPHVLQDKDEVQISTKKPLKLIPAMKLHIHVSRTKMIWIHISNLNYYFDHKHKMFAQQLCFFKTFAYARLKWMKHEYKVLTETLISWRWMLPSALRSFWWWWIIYWYCLLNRNSILFKIIKNKNSILCLNFI